MNPPRLRAALAASVLSLTLGGCIAAAIPLAAGGSILTREEGRASDRPAAATAEAEAPPASPASSAPAGAAQAPGTRGAEELSPAPPAGTYDALFEHAIAQAARDPADEPRHSAILAEPGTLAPETTDCAILPPAVVLDLDPGDATRDFATLAPDPALARGLAALRQQNIAIFWISSASAGRAGTLRTRLRENRLDPAGRDGLLLMRGSQDRKQIRREELAKTHCVVAIAGDRRSDFDELFEYLKEPAAASALDPLFGNGWFLLLPPQDTKEN